MIESGNESPFLILFLRVCAADLPPSSPTYLGFQVEQGGAQGSQWQWNAGGPPPLPHFFFFKEGGEVDGRIEEKSGWVEQTPQKQMVKGGITSGSIRSAPSCPSRAILSWDAVFYVDALCKCGKP